MTATSDRVERLLAEMTTEEKAGQLVQYFYFDVPELDPDVVGDADQPALVEAALTRGAVGSLLFVKDPAEANRLQRAAIEGNRQGIPALFGFDVIHGLRTILPVPVAMAATWDPDLVERGAAVAAREARAVGIHWTFAPMVDIARDPRWGRIVEGAGEDPLLGSAMAAAQVRGFQGDDLTDGGHVLAGPKHFAGYGAPIGGRDYDEVDLSDQQLFNVHLPPFAAAIEAGAVNVMTAYMALNGVPATGNRWLLRDVLRGELGFEGFVVSDANAARNLVTHHFAADLPDAAARALTAGLDLEMAMSDPAFDHLESAVERGLVDEAQLDEAVRRLLTVKERLGLFDDPYVDEDAAAAVLADPGHREVAREAAERTAVLLRNEDRLLPLDPATLGSVAVIGPLSDSARDMLGPWVFDHDLDETVTILDGLRERLGDAVEIFHQPGCQLPTRTFPSMFSMFEPDEAVDERDAGVLLAEAVQTAAAADVAVVVLGERQDMIGEAASRATLELPGDQQALLEAVVATGTPTALVLMAGRPLDLRWASQNVPAILQAWYPGTRGGDAVARLLVGDAAPSGRLPFTWPRSGGHVPMHHAHLRSFEPQNQGRRYWDEPSTPLFPFGFGLTYTHFNYEGLTLDRAEVPRDGTVTVSVEVTNAGEVDAVEVVQLYLHQRHGSAARPVRQLQGFRTLHVAPGTTQRVQFEVGPNQRRYWSAATREWTLDQSTFDVWVGGDATAHLHAEFTVTDA